MATVGEHSKEGLYVFYQRRKSLLQLNQSLTIAIDNSTNINTDGKDIESSSSVILKPQSIEESLVHWFGIQLSFNGTILLYHDGSSGWISIFVIQVLRVSLSAFFCIFSFDNSCKVLVGDQWCWLPANSQEIQSVWS
ncbi:hypothetical protein PPL_08216 [Heterostelium album PN500]|uniref:Uncharacterized protein n=1 Tax=Heterostelium pallidum (strain ATCC 26659 / Pp 5 / PN500) TaxID=670386 RepID=D3BIY1_HETP5|nr:hypothetical protein PPL_08216 [Heterostelium album PN500]EFA78755.1 hypothetical protein PPL_08216 [Heterostelium album PN500]|eukprot:XP_020430879.1 hypothetical protein PPL_08216 [Heterostelium album PN500]